MRLQRAAFLTTAALLSGALQLVAAHGDGHSGMGMAAAVPKKPGQEMTPTEIAHLLPSYFRHPERFGWQLAHLTLMILAWFIAMPLAILLSVARSRYHLPAQVFFHSLNGVGLVAGFVYNHSTPDLYQNNSHHPLGWVVTAFTIVWTLMSIYVAYGEYQSSRRSSFQRGRCLTAARMAQHSQVHQYNDEISTRDSHDSGMGAERNSASLFGSRQNSSDNVHPKPEATLNDLDIDEEDAEENEDPEKAGFLGKKRFDRFISKNVRRVSTQRASKAFRFIQIFTEKILLLLGFAAILSGFIVSAGLFRDRQIFSGLAHYIKGGIFFWYGLLTMGRWMGAFTEFGWAWNNRPESPIVSKWKTMIPSAEFTESFVIWLYGASNVFLEHLNNWGDAWTPSDLEHLSITILFFGGGLLGMMLESSWLRDLTNTTTILQKTKGNGHTATHPFTRSLPIEASEPRWSEPTTYRTPLNPMPALTIMLLGTMMSGHHQDSMVSTMMHAQWGGLFTAFALARAATYITLYLKPPTSHFPSRPPSEIVAAFCLTSGGLIFMNSAADTVWAVESNGLDAMTMFTVTMGLTGIILAWEVVVFAIKGWAVRQESGVAGRGLA